MWWFHIASPLAEIKSSLRWIVVILWRNVLPYHYYYYDHYYYIIIIISNILRHNLEQSKQFKPSSLAWEKKYFLIKTQSLKKKKQAKMNMGESYNDKKVFFNKKFLKKNRQVSSLYWKQNLSFQLNYTVRKREITYKL